ncbi:MAG TPA: hypothetical protein PLP29_11760 [Candidatus Ozemobacteraceae bacterium]|nr:hypothetical protein [Candidatus Ozemobacteraceae bacterium]
MVVFPNIATCAHFDDKVAQKYLLETIDAPFIPTWVFYKRHTAMKWIEKAAWPKVFKLSSGAGSINVRLVRSREEATALCRQAFGRGFPIVAGYLTDIHTRVHKTQTAYEFLEKLFRAPQTLLNVIALRYRMPRQRGYLYFQEFIPGNTFDTRITIIGNRAFGFQRMNRPNDFRASGSGTLSFDPDQIDKRCVEIAFKVADRIGTQSLAFDFLFDLQKKPLIVEISYCYVASAVHQCPGHWDRQGIWHQGQVWPEEAILEDVLFTIRQRKETEPTWKTSRDETHIRGHTPTG